MAYRVQPKSIEMEKLEVMVNERYKTQCRHKDFSLIDCVDYKFPIYLYAIGRICGKL